MHPRCRHCHRRIENRSASRCPYCGHTLNWNVILVRAAWRTVKKTIRSKGGKIVAGTLFILLVLTLIVMLMLGLLGYV